MKLLVQRKWKDEKSTIGELYIDGEFECFTLEDVVRPKGEKVYGQTAIPAGSYRVVIDFSNHFGRRLPHILDVPGFDGIRIHAGNTDADTDGCILVGKTRGEDFIGHSKEEFEAFFKKLDGQKDITIEVL